MEYYYMGQIKINGRNKLEELLLCKFFPGFSQTTRKEATAIFAVFTNFDQNPNFSLLITM